MENWKHASKIQLIQSFQPSRAWLFHLYFCQIPQHETLIIAIAIHHVRVSTKQPVHGSHEQNKWKQKRLALIKKKKLFLLGWIQTIYRLHQLYNFCCKRGVAEIDGITATWNPHKNSIKCVMQNSQSTALLYRITGYTSIWHQEQTGSTHRQALCNMTYWNPSQKQNIFVHHTAHARDITHALIW